MKEDSLKLNVSEEELFTDVCDIIDGTQKRIASYINTEICMTNWYIGKRIKEDVLYLRYLNKNERKKGEESHIGLILCSEGNTEHIEYLMLDEESPIKVGQYYTKLPNKEILSEKLKRAISIAREHYIEQLNKKD